MKRLEPHDSYGGDGNKEESKRRRIFDDNTQVKEDDEEMDAEAKLRKFLKDNPILVQQLGVEKIQQIVNEESRTTRIISSEDLINHIHPTLKAKLKTHQMEAIDFLFKRVITDSKGPGNGAVIAHNMGLGKTFTIIAFIYTIISWSQLRKDVGKILLVVPKNVLKQWKSEIDRWINDYGGYSTYIAILERENLSIEKLQVWHEQKNKVLLLTYDGLKLCLDDQNCKKYRDFKKYLTNPDIAIFDEAHCLKNETTQIYQKILKLKSCNRKIFVTGTPHQNNLKEFYYLIDLIQPNILHKYDTFKSFFEDPINDGQAKDAPEVYVKQMQRRCYALYGLLKDVIHRKSLNYMKSIMVTAEKTEMTILVRPSKTQTRILENFLQEFLYTGKQNQFMEHISVMLRVLSHPTLVFEYAESKVAKNKEYSLDWMKELKVCNNIIMHCQYLSNKIVLLLKIIKLCEKKGEKIIIFSKFQYVFDFIEKILHYYESAWLDDKNQKFEWIKGVDYHRIDGGTSATDRQRIQEDFNNPACPQLRLLLISSLAGGLGTNFKAASRVVLLDQHWNPMIDIQALYRVFRMDQIKPVFIYRLVTYGTSEHVIYKRQIDKESIAHRVIDREDIYNNFTKSERETCYMFDQAPYEKPLTLKPEFTDDVLHTLVQNHPEAIVDVESHDSFFDPCPSDELGSDEHLDDLQLFQRLYGNETIEIEDENSEN